jgi:Outer membrane protein beta-barrel domain
MHPRRTRFHLNSRMGLLKNTTATLFIFATASFAQILGPVSVGVKAGIPVTDAFSNTAIGPNQSLYSNSQNYILGPSVELRLPYRLSVEFDALYRPLTFGTSTATIVNGSPVLSTSSTTLSTWEFPLLVKYHFAAEHRVKPYVDLGPSFRAGAQQLSYLSNSGVTTGLGADLKVPFVRLSPEFRYTHWSGDGAHNATAAPLGSRLDQVEFLFGISF